MPWSGLKGKRVAVWGAGREARAAAIALRGQMPALDLTIIGHDAESIGDGDWRVAQAEPDLDTLRRFDVVVKSPGISPYRAPIPEAEAAGVRFVSGTALWFEANPNARVIAVTGTKGKSTTCALIAHLLRHAGKRVALCGNIGTPLLELLLPPVQPDFWVVELSSFQVRDMDAVPEIAVVLNLYPEHLDWHDGAENYFRDKLRLLGGPGSRPRISVLNAMQPLPAGNRPERGVVEFNDADGFHVHDGAIYRRTLRLAGLAELPLVGIHNARNVCAALTAIAAVGVEIDDPAAALRGFKSLPHRMQSLGTRDGVEYVNDSIATTPQATLAALAHYADRRTTVLVGGYDRGVDWQPVGAALAVSAPAVLIALGQTAERILATLADLPRDRPLRLRAESIVHAMQLAKQHTPAGGVVLLSPGSPSFGEFRDYVDRGRRFAALAGFDPGTISHIEGLGL